MKPYYQDSFTTLYHGDNREILPLLTFDSILTDPPYGVGANNGTGKYGRLRAAKKTHAKWDDSAVGLGHPPRSANYRVGWKLL